MVRPTTRRWAQSSTDLGPHYGDDVMTTRKISVLSHAAALVKRAHIGVAAGLLAAAIAGGWVASPMFSAKAAAVEDRLDLTKQLLEEAKPALIGSYAVTGTDPDG